jgi:hypothetical protein
MLHIIGIKRNTSVSLSSHAGLWSAAILFGLDGGKGGTPREEGSASAGGTGKVDTVAR